MGRIRHALLVAGSKKVGRMQDVHETNALVGREMANQAVKTTHLKGEP